MAEPLRIKPFTAIAVEGLVLIEAAGVALTMKPDAASASASDLMTVASLAQRQGDAVIGDQETHSGSSSSDRTRELGEDEPEQKKVRPKPPEGMLPREDNNMQELGWLSQT
jgi:hypothetical protein